MADHGGFTGVVCRNRELRIRKQIEKIPEIADAAVDIFADIVAVRNAEAARCRRDQLHDALRALWRRGERIVIAFDLNYRVDE